MSDQPPSGGSSLGPVGRGVLLAAAGLVAALVVALTAALLGGDSGPELATGAPTTDESGSPTTDEAPSTSGPSDTGEAPPDPPFTSADPDDPTVPVPLDEILPELIAFVEQERGLEFLTEPVVTAQPEDEFVEQFLETLDEDLNEDPDELALYESYLHLFDVLDDDVDFVEAYRSFGSDGVLGYYDTEVDELYVRGDQITPFVRTTIVHELVHALEDQHFELFRPEYDEALDEVGSGFSAVVEGSAVVIENRYRDTLSEAELRSIEIESSSFDYDLSLLTIEFLTLQFAPYQYGEILVGSIWEARGADGVDQALEAPPRTSEAFIDPGAYLAGETRLEIPPPPADGEVVDEGVVGQLFLQTILTEELGFGDAFDTADGWGGDWYVAWQGDDGTCMRFDVVGDTDADTDEFVDGLGEWADAFDGATLEDADGRARVLVCES